MQKSPLVDAGMELARGGDFSATETQDKFAKNLQPLPGSPQLWATRQKTLSVEDIKLRQCALYEICWLAAVWIPDICARLARIASRVNSLQGSDAYRVNALVTTVKMQQQAAVLKYWSSSHAGTADKGVAEGKMRQRSESWRNHDTRGMVACGIW